MLKIIEKLWIEHLSRKYYEWRLTEDEGEREKELCKEFDMFCLRAKRSSMESKYVIHPAAGVNIYINIERDGAFWVSWRKTRLKNGALRQSDESIERMTSDYTARFAIALYKRGLIDESEKERGDMNYEN